MSPTSKYTPFTTLSIATGYFCNGKSGYFFRFNGKENDKEGMGGGGNTYDYGFRIYNAQLGKFLSVDPLTPSYPWYTPYQFAGNKPINNVDLDGLEAVPVNPETKPADPNILALMLFVTNPEVKNSLDEIWNRSINNISSNGRKPIEHGFVVWSYKDISSINGQTTVIHKVGSGKIQVGSTSGIHLSYSIEFPNTIGILGDVHTHPYESSLDFGMPQSFDDVMRLFDNDHIQQGYISMVESGDTRFALVVSDAAKATSFFSSKNSRELKNLYNEGIKQFKGTNKSEGYKAGLLMMLKDSGIDLYETVDSSKEIFQKVL